MDKSPFYVYVLRRPDGDPFYVGMGRGNRIYQHERAAKRGARSHKCNVIREILAQGLDVHKEIVGYFSSPDTAKIKEIELIKTLGRADIGTGLLTNHTDGGDGVIGWNKDMRMAQSIRGSKTMSNPAHKEKLLRIHLGRKHTRAEIEKRAAALRGKKQDPVRVEIRAAKCRGKKRDPEIVARHAEFLRGRKASPAKLALMSFVMKRRYADPKARTEQSIRMRAALSSEIVRAKLSAAQIGRKHSAETRGKMSASRIGHKCSPETIERMRKAASLRESNKRASCLGSSWDA